MADPRLAWRNLQIASPNVSGLLKQASDSFNVGVGAAQGALEKYQKGVTERIDNEVLGEIAGISSSEELDAWLGQGGLKGRQISDDMQEVMAKLRGDTAALDNTSSIIADRTVRTGLAQNQDRRNEANEARLDAAVRRADTQMGINVRQDNRAASRYANEQEDRVAALELGEYVAANLGDAYKQGEAMDFDTFASNLPDGVTAAQAITAFKTMLASSSAGQADIDKQLNNMLKEYAAEGQAYVTSQDAVTAEGTAKAARAYADSLPGLTTSEKDKIFEQVVQSRGVGATAELYKFPVELPATDRNLIENTLDVVDTAVESLPETRILSKAARYDKVEPHKQLISELGLDSGDSDALFGTRTVLGILGYDGAKHDEIKFRNFLNKSADEMGVSPQMLAAAISESFTRDPWGLNTYDNVFDLKEAIKTGLTQSQQTQYRDMVRQRDTVVATQQKITSQMETLYKKVKSAESRGDSRAAAKYKGQIATLRSQLQAQNQQLTARLQR